MSVLSPCFDADLPYICLLRNKNRDLCSSINSSLTEHFSTALFYFRHRMEGYNSVCIGNMIPEVYNSFKPKVMLYSRGITRIPNDLPQVPYLATYVPNFITEEEESEIKKHVNNAPLPKWTQLSHRRLQNWGGIPHPKGMIGEAIPRVSVSGYDCLF